MSNKVFLIDKSIATELVQIMPVAELELKAKEVLTVKDFVDRVSNNTINLQDNMPVYREVLDEEIHVNMGRNGDWQEIVINNELQLHVATSSGEGYSVDLYIYREGVADEDRDWDSELVSSAYATFAELDDLKAEPEE